MKTTLKLSLLCATILFGTYAQAQDNTTTERQAIKERAEAVYQQTNGNMGPGTRMHYKSTYSNIHALYPDAPANAVAATPSSPYVALQDPPCYKYKTRSGLEVMECPGARFMPEDNGTQTASNDREMTVPQNKAADMNVNASRSYSGYYPDDIHAVYPQAPKNAIAAWPESSYTELQNPPCYKYMNRRGLEVMECPGAQFAPEHEYR